MELKRKSFKKVGDMQTDAIAIVSAYRESKLTIWTLMWTGFWTGVVVCGFVLFLR
jgi:hypothetical protein